MSWWNLLENLKAFLTDEPEKAVLAISLTVNALMFGMYVRARDAHVKSLMMILPLATRLSDLLSLAASKAKARSNPPDGIYRSSDSGIREKE